VDLSTPAFTNFVDPDMEQFGLTSDFQCTSSGWPNDQMDLGISASASECASIHLLVAWTGKLADSSVFAIAATAVAEAEILGRNCTSRWDLDLAG
jgi:hypothetical protein